MSWAGSSTSTNSLPETQITSFRASQGQPDPALGEAFAPGLERGEDRGAALRGEDRVEALGCTWHPDRGSGNRVAQARRGCEPAGSPTLRSELTPCPARPPWSRSEPVTAQDRPDRGRGRDPGLGQLCVDPQASTEVLPSHPQDEVTNPLRQLLPDHLVDGSL